MLYNFALILINIIANYMRYQAKIVAKLADNQTIDYQFIFFSPSHNEALTLLRKYMHVHNCTYGSLHYYHEFYQKYVFVCTVECPPSVDFDKIPIPDCVNKEPCFDCLRLF